MYARAIVLGVLTRTLLARHLPARAARADSLPASGGITIIPVTTSSPGEFTISAELISNTQGAQPCTSSTTTVYVTTTASPSSNITGVPLASTSAGLPAVEGLPGSSVGGLIASILGGTGSYASLTASLTSVETVGPTTGTSTAENAPGIIASILGHSPLSTTLTALTHTTTHVETKTVPPSLSVTPYNAQPQSLSTTPSSSTNTSECSQSQASYITTGVQGSSLNTVLLPTTTDSVGTPSSTLPGPSTHAPGPSTGCNSAEVEAIASFCSIALTDPLRWATFNADITVGDIHVYINERCVTGAELPITFTDCLLGFIQSCKATDKPTTSASGGCQLYQLDTVDIV